MPKTFAFVLDFTYDGQKVFALEMGDFFKSGVSGLDRLRQKQDQIPLHEEYHNMLLQRYPNAVYLKDETTPWTSAITFYDFPNMLKARCNFKDDTLIPYLLYSRALSGAEHFFTRPLVASFGANGFPPQLRSSLAKLQKIQQNTLDILNYPSGVLIDACQDKVVFHQFTEKTGFCPTTLLVDLLNVNLNDVAQFLAANPSFHYVIKPTNMSLGIGVEVLDSKKVVKFIQQLQKIADPSEAREFRSQSDQKKLAIWEQIILNKGNHFLLLQTCCPSKEVKYEGKAYRPTARTIIEATFADDLSILPTLHFLGNYWKFPVLSSDTMTTLSLVSNVEDDSPTASIEANDWQVIKNQLQKYLPSILLDLYSTDFDKLSTHFESSPTLQRYQKNLRIDELSCQMQQKYIFPESNKALSCFKQFEYGGPGFNEYLHHFKNAICISSSLEEALEKNQSIVSNSISDNITFFKPNSLSVEEKSELTTNDCLDSKKSIKADNDDGIGKETAHFNWCQIL